MDRISIMKVWENLKKQWKLSPTACVRIHVAFLTLPNLHSCFYNLIETQRTCFQTHCNKKVGNNLFTLIIKM